MTCGFVNLIGRVMPRSASKAVIGERVPEVSTKLIGLSAVRDYRATPASKQSSAK